MRTCIWQATNFTRTILPKHAVFTVHENCKHLNNGSDRLSEEMVEKHIEAAIEFILAAIRN